MELGDARRTQRLIKLVEDLSAQPTGSIPLASGGWAETKAAYRLLDNPAVDWREILEVHTQRTGERMQGQPVVLCIQDTTELDFTSQPGIAGLGRLSYEAQHGLYAHATLVVRQRCFDEINRPNSTDVHSDQPGEVMAKKYMVRLSEAERAELGALVKTGRAAARKRLHAQILLKADEGEHGPAWTDAAILKALDVSSRTVERVRQGLVEDGVETALNGHPQQRYKSPKLDGEQEAYLVALACSAPPEGRNRWTLRLLADRMVELEYVDTVSYETVRQVLKKTN